MTLRRGHNFSILKLEAATCHQLPCCERLPYYFQMPNDDLPSPRIFKMIFTAIFILLLSVGSISRTVGLLGIFAGGFRDGLQFFDDPNLDYNQTTREAENLGHLSHTNISQKDTHNTSQNKTVRAYAPAAKRPLQQKFFDPPPMPGVAANSNDKSKATMTTKQIVLPTLGNISSLKLPTPIFLASLPKSGTTSVWRFFNCGGVWAAHLYGKNETGGFLLGQCMKQNSMVKNHSIFEGCGSYSVWTDTGLVEGPPANTCYYPAIEGLDDIYQSHPNATILLLVRDKTSWGRSVKRWKRGSLVARWRRCNLTGFQGDSLQQLMSFYEWHKDLVRQFAKEHPSITFLEFSLEDSNLSSLLEESTGISSKCWAKCDPTKKTCEVESQQEVDS